MGRTHPRPNPGPRGVYGLNEMYQSIVEECERKRKKGGFFKTPMELHAAMGFELPIHQAEMYRVAVDQKRALLLEPRDHGKSTCLTHIYATWRVLNNPDVRILLISKSQRQSRKFVDQIKKTLESPVVNKLYGDLRGNPWTSDCFTVKRTSLEKDYTVEGIGVVSAVTGGHFHLIIADDILDDENTKTDMRMETVENWWRGTVLQLAEPDTQILVVGTRKHYKDLYNKILQDNTYYHMVRKAILKYPDSYQYIPDKDGVVRTVATTGESEVLWPERWTIQALLLDRMQTGHILFEREKQNDPSGMMGRVLKREWLHYYTLDPLRSDADVPICPPLSNLSIYGGVDPSTGEEESDYFAISTWGVTRSGPRKRCFLLEIIRERVEFPQQVKLLKNCYKKWHHIAINVESNAYQKALVQQARSDSMLPLFPITTSKDKMTRFIGMSPFFENGTCLIHETHHQVFEDEWLDFPVGEHDDVLDSTELCLKRILTQDQFKLLGDANAISR